MKAPAKRRTVAKYLQRSDNTAWQIVRILLWITGISLGIFAAITLVCLVNASSEVRRCLNITRFNVQPATPALPPDAEHEPSAFGYIFFDTQQRFVRWRIADDYTSAGVAVTDIDLHGPLTPESPDVAPVVLDLRATRTPATHYFRGNVTIDSRLLFEIQNDPGAYYFALYTGVGAQRREIGRDLLNKLC